MIQKRVSLSKKGIDNLDFIRADTGIGTHVRLVPATDRL
jgi:hypothetical protein